MPEPLSRSLGAWLAYLEKLHPQAIDLGLERVRQVAERLRLLPWLLPTLTVAGTNGKGSVVYAADSILRAHGLRTGRYSSPHLLRFNERIVINGEEVSDEALCRSFEIIDRVRGEISLSYFEFTTLAALLLMREADVELAVLEIGLGGRLDAVNMVDPTIAVITAIGLDHQQWLGDSLELIGPEKAAIARSGRPVVRAERAYPDSVASTLDAIGARRYDAGHDWDWSAEEVGRLHWRLGDRQCDLPLPESLRAANVAAAVTAAALHLGERFACERAATALAALQIPGRRQRLDIAGRELLLDVAHNPDAMRALAGWLRRHPCPGRTVAAFAALADKDIPSMAAALSQVVDGAWAVALPSAERAVAAERLWQILDSVGCAVPQGEFTVEAVWAQLLERSNPGDRIVVCGSFLTVAAIMSHLELSTSPGQGSVG